MQGWHFLRLVDFYNNIPFDDALKGTSNPTPSYEDGEQVYRKSIDLISLGIEEVKAPPTLSEGAEMIIVFEGTGMSWAGLAIPTNNVHLIGKVKPVTDTNLQLK